MHKLEYLKESLISSDYLSFSPNFTKFWMDGGESDSDLGGGEGQAIILLRIYLERFFLI
jgi:hypothetical protein